MLTGSAHSAPRPADHCESGAKLELLVRECFGEKRDGRSLQQHAGDFFENLWWSGSSSESARQELAAQQQQQQQEQGEQELPLGFEQQQAAAEDEVQAVSSSSYRTSQYDYFERVPLNWNLDQFYSEAITLQCASQVRGAGCQLARARRVAKAAAWAAWVSGRCQYPAVPH